ncbi:MAG: IS110 family transposase [Candidatus Tectomicrobia bacterium]|nr:IS110 family transposase [Candidatus Tectomicrobia bacterium]
MSRIATHEFAAFVGLDWADTKHDISLQVSGSNKREVKVLEHKPEVIDVWATNLLQRFKGEPIAIALELNKGPIVEALRKYDGFVLFHINPMMLAKYRQAFTPSRAKDDPTDAELQLELLLRHRDKLTPLVPQSPKMRALAQLVEHRRRFVGDRVRITNRLTSTLKNYFPQVLEWFPSKETKLFCDFLTGWPTLKAAQLARRSTLERFFRQHHVRGDPLIQKRLEAIKSAMPLTTDDGVIVPHAFMAQALITQLRVTLEAIESFDQAIAERAKSHPDFALFEALPGAGPALAPRLLVAFGEQRERYGTAAELQQYAGIAPVLERSGKQSWVHWRRQCPTFLRQTFVEWASLSIPFSFWAQAYYEQQRDKGTSHQAAVRALAFKWIRIVFRCWQTGTPYNESAYLAALKRRESPLISNLATSSEKEEKG